MFLALSFGIHEVYSQSEARNLERTIPYIQNHDIYLELDYVELVNIRYWERDSIKIVASIDLAGEKGVNKNDDFDLQITSANGKHNFLGKILNQTAHYVYQKSGTDHNPQGALKKKILIVGTQIELFIPMNANLETNVKGMGHIEIDHNGANLLASTMGNITATIDTKLNADINMRSQFGDILVDNLLNISEIKSDKTFKKLKSSEDLAYKLNDGGDIMISFSTFGTIKILPKQ